MDKKIKINNEYYFDSINHVHTFKGKVMMGTSTIIGVISKNLTWWSAELSAVECLETGEHIPTIREEYLKAKVLGKQGIDELQKKYPIFKKARFAHFVDKKEKADKGTDLHEELENYVKSCNGKPKLVENPLIQDFINWSVNEVDEFMFSEKNVYSREMWSGGIFDVIFKLKNGKIILGDFKSSKESYISQFIQIAGYDLQQSENGILTKEGEKISEPLKIDGYCVFPFGAKKFTADFRYNTEELKNGFKSAVVLYKLTN